MKMIPLVKGISLNMECRGLLCLHADMLSSLMGPGKITDYYHVEQTPFARGKFAAVRKCTHKVTGVEYAAKFIRKRRRSMDQRNDIYHEVAVLKLAEHCNNIVNIHEVYETPTEIALILQLVAGGELQRVIDVYDGLEEQQTVRVLKQILEGLNFLHSYNIAHLDLKPQNLLITSSFPNCDIRLCDFGISRVIESGIELREILGTPDYVAPEVLNYEPISLATDVWSIGVLTYVLLSGYSPFAGDTKQETFCNIAQCALSFPEELFHNVSDYAKDFIMATLVRDVNQRLTVEECIRHPWLNNNSLMCKTISPYIQVEDDDNSIVSKSIAIVNGCNGKTSCNAEQQLVDELAENDEDDNDNGDTVVDSNGIDTKVDKKYVAKFKIDINNEYAECCSRLNPQRKPEVIAHFSNSRSVRDPNTNNANNNNNNNNNNTSNNNISNNSSSDKKSNGVVSTTVEILLDRSITC